MILEGIFGLTDYLDSSTAFQLSRIMRLMLGSLTDGFFYTHKCLKIILFIPFLFWLITGLFVMLITFRNEDLII